MEINNEFVIQAIKLVLKLKLVIELELKMMSGQNPERSVATDDDRSYSCWPKNKTK